MWARQTLPPPLGANTLFLPAASISIMYEPVATPKLLTALQDKVVSKITCGQNHSIATDMDGCAYTWGNGGYGRLGHKVQVRAPGATGGMCREGVCGLWVRFADLRFPRRAECTFLCMCVCVWGGGGGMQFASSLQGGLPYCVGEACLCMPPPLLFTNYAMQSNQLACCPPPPHPTPDVICRVVACCPPPAWCQPCCACYPPTHPPTWCHAVLWPAERRARPQEGGGL